MITHPHKGVIQLNQQHPFGQFDSQVVFPISVTLLTIRWDWVKKISTTLWYDVVYNPSRSINAFKRGRNAVNFNWRPSCPGMRIRPFSLFGEPRRKQSYSETGNAFQNILCFEPFCSKPKRQIQHTGKKENQR